MSQVTLLTADAPLPLCHGRVFSAEPLNYYRSAVELLGLPMKPFRYELELPDTDAGAAALREYLRAQCPRDSQVQLWNLWVGDADVRPFRLTGPLEELDGETLQQLRERQQTCLTITL